MARPERVLGRQPPAPGRTTRAAPATALNRVRSIVESTKESRRAEREHHPLETAIDLELRMSRQPPCRRLKRTRALITLDIGDEAVLDDQVATWRNKRRPHVKLAKHVIFGMAAVQDHHHTLACNIPPDPFGETGISR